MVKRDVTTVPRRDRNSASGTYVQRSPVVLQADRQTVDAMQRGGAALGCAVWPASCPGGETTGRCAGAEVLPNRGQDELWPVGCNSPLHHILLSCVSLETVVVFCLVVWFSTLKKKKIRLEEKPFSCIRVMK